jgi:hypothetical protein
MTLGENHLPDDDLVLFALQLLPEERMRQAMPHLQACESCRAEIARIQGDLAAYSMTAAPVPPPATARERFVRQVSREPRLEEIRLPEPRRAEQRRAESRNAEQRNTEHRHAEPRNAEQRNAEPRNAEQRSADSFSSASLSGDSRSAEPRSLDSRPIESSSLESRPPEKLSLSSEPKLSLSAEPAPAASSRREPNEPVFAARQSRTLRTQGRQEEDEDLREERHRPRRAPWVLAWTGWALAAGCSFVAGLQLHQRQQMQGVMTTQQAKIDGLQQQAADARQAQEALSTLTAANALQVALHATPPLKPAVVGKGVTPVVAPEALAAYLADKGALVFVATHLEPAPAGKTYELWLLPANGQSPIPAGTFKPDPQGSASIVMPRLPKGVPAKGFGVTIENDGGSSTPTLPIVMS